MSKFSERLKELRKSKGLSQEELAERLNIKRSALGNYEQGLREPDNDTLESIADFFNVDIDYIFGRKDTTTFVSNSFPEFELEHIELLKLYTSLSDENKKLVLNMMRSLIK
jgi:transcriptional regulator with XRE-family HTH domain